LSLAQRKLFGEMSALVDKMVMVVTADEKTYIGTLVGIDPSRLSLCLGDAKDEKGQSFHKIFLNGNVVAKIFLIGKPFDLKALAQRLEKVFPTMVKLYEDKGFIWVMEKIKVTKDGVVEGSGPAAERVQKVYEQFISEMKGSK